MLDYLKPDSNLNEFLIRSTLSDLGFEQKEIMNKVVNQLIAGEATCLLIAKLFTDKSNVIILEELTNFNDLGTIEVI